MHSSQYRHRSWLFGIAIYLVFQSCGSCAHTGESSRHEPVLEPKIEARALRRIRHFYPQIAPRSNGKDPYFSEVREIGTVSVSGLDVDLVIVGWHIPASEAEHGVGEILLLTANNTEVARIGRLMAHHKVTLHDDGLLEIDNAMPIQLSSLSTLAAIKEFGFTTGSTQGIVAMYAEQAVARWLGQSSGGRESWKQVVDERLAEADVIVSSGRIERFTVHPVPFEAVRIAHFGKVYPITVRVFSTVEIESSQGPARYTIEWIVQHWDAEPMERYDIRVVGVQKLGG